MTTQFVAARDAQGRDIDLTPVLALLERLLTVRLAASQGIAYER